MCGVEMKKDEFMKTRNLQTVLAVMAVSGMAFSATTMLAQDSTATSTVQPAAVNASAPQLAYGASQILQLAQSKVGEDTIIAYIKNSGNSYALNADQIIYLQQQGVSSAVIATMLNQPKLGLAAAAAGGFAGQHGTRFDGDLCSNRAGDGLLLPALLLLSAVLLSGLWLLSECIAVVWLGWLLGRRARFRRARRRLWRRRARRRVWWCQIWWRRSRRRAPLKYFPRLGETEFAEI